jgi:hypothetical protein
VPENLTDFKILKQFCPLRGASILTVIVRSAIWSLVEIERWLVLLINVSTLP